MQQYGTFLSPSAEVSTEHFTVIVIAAWWDVQYTLHLWVYVCSRQWRTVLCDSRALTMFKWTMFVQNSTEVVFMLYSCSQIVPLVFAQECESETKFFYLDKSSKGLDNQGSTPCLLGGVCVMVLCIMCVLLCMGSLMYISTNRSHLCIITGLLVLFSSGKVWKSKTLIYRLGKYIINKGLKKL